MFREINEHLEAIAGKLSEDWAAYNAAKAKGTKSKYAKGPQRMKKGYVSPEQRKASASKLHGGGVTKKGLMSRKAAW